MYAFLYVLRLVVIVTVFELMQDPPTHTNSTPCLRVLEHSFSGRSTQFVNVCPHKVPLVKPGMGDLGMTLENHAMKGQMPSALLLQRKVGYISEMLCCV